MLKYYIAIAILAAVAASLGVYAACQNYACKDYLGDFKLGGPPDPLAKYQEILKDPRFAKANILEIGGRIPETDSCELYRRAIQSITLGTDRETTSQKVEAILIYQQADEQRCTPEK